MFWESKVSTVFLAAQAFLVVAGIGHNQSLLNNYETHRNQSFFRDLATRTGMAEELLLPGDNHPAPKAEMNSPIFSRNRVQRIVFDQWRGKGKEQVAETVQALFEEAARFGFDPYFLLAVIERESRFNPNAKGQHGEIGLMQIKPDTAEWISERYGFPWQGAQTLYQPAHNIRLAAAYFDFLRRSFRQNGLHYLSAYNMGPRRTRQVLRDKNNRSFYADEVIGNYLRIYSRMDQTNDNG